MTMLTPQNRQRELGKLTKNDRAEYLKFERYLKDAATMPAKELHTKYAEYLGAPKGDNT